MMVGKGLPSACLLVLTWWCGEVHAQNECPEFEVGSHAVLWDRSKVHEGVEEPPDNQLLTVVKCKERGENDYLATVRDIAGQDYELTTEALKAIIVGDPENSFMVSYGRVLFTLMVATLALIPKFFLPWWRHRKKNLAAAQGKAKAQPKPQAKPQAKAQAGGQGVPRPGGPGPVAGLAFPEADKTPEWRGWVARGTGQPDASLRVTRLPGGGISVSGAQPPNLNGTYELRGQPNGKPQHMHSGGAQCGRTWYLPDKGKHGLFFLGAGDEASYITGVDPPA